MLICSRIERFKIVNAIFEPSAELPYEEV